MSSTFSGGSLERLKVRSRSGWRLWASQMRWTVLSDRPEASAMVRPVQWVTSPGGSEQVSATTLATMASGMRGLPGLRLPLAQQPLDTTLGVMALLAPHRRAAHFGPACHLQRR
jgi:hypothetical protein